jgi:ribonuclease BN (tRNA processing enzyme)
MRVVCCGVRGSTPAPGARFAEVGGHTSCVAVAHDGALPTLVLDAGTGVRGCTALLGDAPFVGTIVLGHLHWDHVQGLPFFTAADRPDARVRVLVPRPVHPDATVPSAEALLDRFMAPPWFPVRTTELRGQWSVDWLDEGTTEVEGFTVTAREVPHGGGRTMGLRVASSDGASLAYLSDHAPHLVGPGTNGVGALHAAARELATDVDALFHDAQFTTDELAEFAHFGHSCASYACELAEAARAARLLLFHHHPERDDAAVMALTTDAAARCRVPVAAATEGMVIDL